MATETAFAPHYGANNTLTANTVSTSVSVRSSTHNVRLVNDGTHTVFFRIGAGAQTATIADMPLLADDSIVVYKGVGADTVACISPDGSNLVYIQAGEGGD